MNIKWYVLDGYKRQPYSGAVSSDSGKSRMQVYREQLKEKRVAAELDLNLMLMRSTRSDKLITM